MSGPQDMTDDGPTPPLDGDSQRSAPVLTDTLSQRDGGNHQLIRISLPKYQVKHIPSWKVQLNNLGRTLPTIREVHRNNGVDYW